MIRALLLGPFRIAEPWVRHPNWLIRRAAQVAALGVATVWLALPNAKKPDASAVEESDELLRKLLSSQPLREFLHGPAIAKPVVGHLCRILVLRLSVAGKMRERANSHERQFALRLAGPINQKVLRNLLIWQNHVLPSYLRDDDENQADLMVVLASGSGDEPRVFDLFSVVLVLARLRSFAVFWEEEAAIDPLSVLMSQRELTRWRAMEPASDLEKMPPDVIRQVEVYGTKGGVKLLPTGRKYANDFLKSALPGRFIIAVALRERDDGTLDREELELWLSLIDRLHSRQSRAAFVVLNCLAPSQQREWPAHIRFARHQGLTLQDAICLAQIADGYLGVLDIFGLAAHSAGRPGVYVPLEDTDLGRAERCSENSQDRRIMVGSRNRADIEMAVETFFAGLQRLYIDAG
jgi:hypothetical protein